jgi:hypothetical protein
MFGIGGGGGGGLGSAMKKSGAGSRGPGLHIIFPSFDGHVYIVDGRSGCTNKLDIGEHSYGAVLVDDILGRGKLDLLVTTMSGNVFCFATEAHARLLNVWIAHAQGGGLGFQGFTARGGNALRLGIYFTQATKDAARDIAGAEFSVESVIVEERPNETSSTPKRQLKDRAAAAATPTLLLWPL